MKHDNRLKLHLACGPNIAEGWANIDILEGEKIKHHDLTEPLPYDDASVDAIFHEHFIEHLIKTDAENFLNDCYRVLKTDGAMRLGWPDLEKLLNAYVSKDHVYEDHALPYLEDHRFGAFWDEIIVDCLFDWDHRYAYTAGHMVRILERTGFKNVEIKNAGDSDHGIALDYRRDPATTYIEMIK